MKPISELLSYDPNTGEIRWKVARTNSVTVGDIAGHKRKDGRWVIGIEDQLFLGHRVAWFIHHGEWPSKHIDHINGDPGDNRLVNMRLATDAQNKLNRGKQKNNKSGFKGVAAHKTPYGHKGWRARIKANGKHLHLGVFATPELAHKAYCDAVKLYHGEFGRTQ